MKELADIIRASQQWRGQPLALATLVRSRGSSYRRPGARMLVCPDGSTVGSLSGGCLEEEVAERAAEVLRTGQSSLLEFDTRRRFGCNGTIEILVEAVREEFLAEIATALQERRTCRALTELSNDGPGSGSRMLAPHELVPAGAFVQEIEPALHLIILGEGPDSRPLRSIAELLGWTVVEVEQASDLPTHADERTAAVIKSHHYGRDCAALQHFLQLKLRYVGLLGPRQRRDQILGDLLDRGASFKAELFAPAGLELHAETPEEIALAIASEIQAVFALGTGESLRARKAPIHGWNMVPDPPAAQPNECELSAR